MNKLNPFILMLMALLLGGCVGTTYQRTDITPIGVKTVKRNKGAFHDHTSEEYDSRIAYRDCLSDMNRRQMGPEAVKYCQCKTTPKDEQGPECDMLMYSTGGGMSMMGGGGYMEGSYQPTYYVPAGPSDYEGTAADPRISSRVVDAHEAERRRRSSKDDDDIKPVARQVADNATEIREAQERLDRMEAERSQKE